MAATTIEYFETDVDTPEFSECEEEFQNEPDAALLKWQFKLSKRRKQSIKVKSRIRSSQLILEEQDEKLKSLQEEIAKKLFVSRSKSFDWTSVKAAHLISKVFENCEPVVVDNPQMKPNGEDAKANENEGTEVKEETAVKQEKPDPGDEDEAPPSIPVKEAGEITKDSGPSEKTKCLYTADFHRFAIALYFFSPKAYFFLSNVAPMFPHRNYIRQWVTAGRVEKLFPRGVFREEFNDV